MSDLPFPTSLLHGLWAAVVALFWKLWAAMSSKVEKLEEKVDKMQTAVAKHDVLQEGLQEAITELKGAIKESTEESRRQSEALVRIETILQTAITKEKE